MAILKPFYCTNIYNESLSKVVENRNDAKWADNFKKTPETLFRLHQLQPYTQYDKFVRMLLLQSYKLSLEPKILYGGGVQWGGGDGGTIREQMGTHTVRQFN